MKIAPSIMCADLLRIADVLEDLEAGGADSLHVDVMDGRLVPGFTFGADFVGQLGRATGLPLDLHLMSADPERHIPQFLDCGAATLAVHPEACADPYRMLETIRREGVGAGLALNPGTPLAALTPYLDVLDVVIVMAVCPGFVGQPQIEACRKKAADLVLDLARQGRTDIEVVLDGGVKESNLRSIAACGVHKVVSGSGVFGADRGIREQLQAMQSVAKKQRESPIHA